MKHTDHNPHRSCLAPAAYIHLARATHRRPSPIRPWVDATKFVFELLIPATLLAGLVWLALVLAFTF